MSIIKRGFFPKGNGQIDFEIQSPKKLNNINLINPKYENVTIDGISTLDKNNFINQCEQAQQFLENHNISVDSINSSSCTSSSFGSSICISYSSPSCFIASDIVGNKNISKNEIS